MMFFKKVLFLSLCVLAASHVQAQEKVLLRYPNGQKALTGDCTFYLDAGMPTSLVSEVFQRRVSSSDNDEVGEDTAKIPDVDGSSSEGRKPFSYRLGRLSPFGPVEGLCLSCNGPLTVYYSTGQPSAVASFKAGVPSGAYTSYYPNGQVMVRTTLVQGAPAGDWELHYKQGQRFVAGHFKPYTDSMVRAFWESTLMPSEDREDELRKQMSSKRQTGFTHHGLRSERGVQFYALMNLFLKFDRLLMNLPAQSMKDGAFQYSYRSGEKQAEIHFSNDIRTGTWTYWDEKGQPWAKLYYSDGELKKVADSSQKEYTVEAYTENYEKAAENERKARMPQRVNSDGIDPGVISADIINKPVSAAPSSVFTSAEQMPTFDGDVMRWLADNVIYPAAARKAGIEGRVVIKFIVREDGRVTDATVERSVNKELDAEALRVIQKMPKWKPGRQNGKPVPVYYRLPVKFAIE